MIFISHRREETKSFVTNLHQRLLDRYGKNSVFIDFNDIQSGDPWPDAIKHALQESPCTVGYHWSDMGQRALPIRRESESVATRNSGGLGSGGNLHRMSEPKDACHSCAS